MPYKTLWSKSRADRVYVLFLWITFLLVLNIQMFWGMDWALLFITVFAWYFLYKKVTLFKNTLYTFDKDAIEITVSSKKTYKIPLNDIDTIEREPKLLLPRYTGWNIVDYSTSQTNLISIHTKDHTTIRISPKTIQDRVIKRFPFTEKEHN